MTRNCNECGTEMTKHRTGATTPIYECPECGNTSGGNVAAL